jgi:hypothetical protein
MIIKRYTTPRETQIRRENDKATVNNVLIVQNDGKIEENISINS